MVPELCLNNLPRTHYRLIISDRLPLIDEYQMVPELCLHWAMHLAELLTEGDRFKLWHHLALTERADDPSLLCAGA